MEIKEAIDQISKMLITFPTKYIDKTPNKKCLALNTALSALRTIEWMKDVVERYRMASLDPDEIFEKFNSYQKE